MRGILIGFVLCFVLLSVSAHAAIYYVDASRPDDSGNGLSPETAWKTIGHVNIQTFSPGDFILFKRGEHWRERLNTLSSGEPGNPIVFTYYGSGDKPIIMGSDSIMSGWVLYSGNTWYNDIPSTRPYAIYLDGESYKKATDRDSVDSTNRWYWDSAALRLYIYATSEPSSFYSSIEVPQRSTALRVSSRNYHKYDGLHFKYGRDWTIGFSGTSSYIELVNCTVDGAGQGSSIEFADSVNNIIIDNCRIDGGNKARYNDVIRAIGSGISNCTVKNSEISRGAHAGLLLKYTSNWLIENNEFWSDGQGPNEYGRNIALIGEEGQGNHTFRYNMFRNAGYGNGICLGPDQANGDGNKFYYNIFANAEYRGFHFYIEGNSVIKNFKFYNNIFYGAKAYGILLSSQASGGMEFKNNIIFENDPTTHRQVHLNSGALSAHLFENNTIYDSSTSDTVYDGSAVRTVAWMDNNYPEWNNNIALDPELFDVSNGDFRLQSNSPAIDNGTDVGLTLDFEGNSVPYGPAPDIGAYEYGSQTSGCTGTCKPDDCSTYTDCSLAPGNCSSGQYCCSGSCRFCPNGICEQGETCSSCPSDCDCFPQLCCGGVCSLPVCFQNSDCGTDPCKNYTCSNQGTCQSSCSSQDKTSCKDDDNCCPAGCDEGNDYDCVALKGPVALYHFDENFGNIAGDSSGNGNDGTINGATWTNDSISGYALEFDGSNDSVDLGDSASLRISEDFTITTWIYPTDVTSDIYFTIISKGWDDYWLTVTTLGGNPATTRLEVTATGINTLYTGGGSISANQWYFVALRHDGNNYSLWIDGEMKSSVIDDDDLVTSSNKCEIGEHSPDRNIDYFAGLIDEVRIYDQALTAGEILELYSNPGGEQTPGDLNNDGSVDILDLGIIAGDFGKTSGYDPKADVVQNGEVDIFDVVFVASRFT